MSVRNEIQQENNGTTDSEEKEAVKLKFQELVRRWQHDTRMVSSVSKIIKHPAYQAIIEMGIQALPYILEELRDRPDLWFPSLKLIVGESPVPLEDRTDPELAREAWLTWGRKKGLIE